ncbi:MAG: Peptidase M23 [Parcubacteria group bacterium GW2011_GWB1_43_8b]|nr:MAG: Peptidase M23 [Parcubacteria group bacterium GW2011_GWB1_43_8b]
MLKHVFSNKTLKAVGLAGILLTSLIPSASFATGQASFSSSGAFLVGDHTHFPGSDNWVTSLSNMQPGNEVRLLFTFLNTSSVTAIAAQSRFTAATNGNTITITGTIWAQNAPEVSNSVTISAAPGYTISLSQMSASFGGVGDVLPGSSNIEYYATGLYTITGQSSPPAPTANLWAEYPEGTTVTQVPKGTAVIMKWNSTNADNCSVLAGAGFNTGGATSGSDIVSPLAGTTTFSIHCTGAGGSVQKNYTVTVIETSSLTCFLSVNPSSGNSPLSAFLSASASGGNGGYSYKFNFGDGDIGSFSSQSSVQHIYTVSQSRTFSPAVTVKDSSGTTCDASSFVSVNYQQQQGNAPLVTTNSATNVGQTYATLNGSVNPNGASASYWFEYGQNYSLGSATQSQSTGSGNSSQNASAYISGLSLNTTYYFRIVAQNQYGSAQGSILSFTTGGGGGGGSAPAVNTNSATNVGQSYATLNGQVNPNGISTSYWFEYGQTTSFGNTSQSQSAGSGNSFQNISYSLSNLISNTTYYFRAVGQNQYGVSYGSTLSFTTTGGGGGGGSAPAVNTNSATNVGQTYATLNGSVNPNGASASYWFEYGTTTGLGNTTQSQSAGSGSSSQNISYAISNLVSNTTYYFRVVAQNQYGTAQGSILSFTTTGGGGGGGSTPLVITNPASNTGQNYATLNGSVNPNNTATSYWFEYGTTMSLGNTSAAQNLGSGNSYVSVSYPLSNLIQNTTYYFRVVAQNQYGTAQGSVLSFNTYGGGGGCTYGNAPYVQTYSASNTYQNSATLNGWVSSSGSNAYAWFEYGVNTNSLSYTTNSRYVGGNSNFSESVSNLVSGTTYYFRLVARNDCGTNYGNVLSFSSGGSSYGQIPLVITNSATLIYQNSALLNGQVSPNGGLTDAWFEYGTTTNLGSKTNSQPLGSSNNYLNYSAAVTGLSANTTYYFRAVGQNQYGTGYGNILNFRTSGGGVIIPTTPTIIERPIVVSGGGTSCIILVPALDVSMLSGGQEFTYTVTYRNGCNYNISNAFLKIILPTEVEFISTNYPFFNRDANGISYNLGAVAANYQSAVSIRGLVKDTVKKGDSIIFSAVLNFNDAVGRFQSISAYLTAVVASEQTLTASVFDAFAGLLGNWIFDLLLVVIVLFLVWWIFFKKKEEEERIDVASSEVIM